MIKGLYETHLFVRDIHRSINFYKNVLNLDLAHYETSRRAAFFWIGKPRQSMLGLWEKPENEIDVRHFAFESDPHWVVHEAAAFLHRNNLVSKNFLGDISDKPLVFSWMPAISIYFDDPDGHELEFIGLLNEKPQPDKGVVTYEEWQELNK